MAISPAVPATAKARSSVSRRWALAAAIPRASTCDASAAARRWRTNRSDSVSTTGGSMGSASASRSDARRGRNGSISSPRARAWSHSPSSPNRATSTVFGSSATWPICRRPNRVSRARTSASGERSVDGSGARNAASPPGSTARRTPGSVWPAATVAAKRVPAIPGRGAPGSRSPAARVASASTSRATSSGSGPHSRSSPSACISMSPKAGSVGSVVPASPGLNRASVSKAASTAAASASGSGSRKAASGASRCALPSGIPCRTPSARAAGSASMTVPSVQGCPPRTTGRSVGNESEWRARASRIGRWGQ